MPYRSIADLPPRIREHLPPHAQEIFLEAFNHAWEEYASPANVMPARRWRRRRCGWLGQR
jgi:cation transport regulator ChaB